MEDDQDKGCDLCGLFRRHVKVFEVEDLPDDHLPFKWLSLAASVQVRF